jgi:hypothetical protein
MDDTAKPRWPFWIFAGLSLLWNAYGAYDWLMTNSRNAAYIAQFPPETMQFVDGMPYWALGAWALGVWAAVAGSVLLLLRSRFAVHAFAASLAGLAANTLYMASGGMLMSRPAGLTIAIWVVAIALLWYAMRMHKRGVLR